MLTIAHQEGLKLSRERIDQIIESSNHDIRQTIYNLQLAANGADANTVQEKDCAQVSVIILKYREIMPNLHISFFLNVSILFVESI